MSHEQDAEDHNLPLMIWYGMEPVVPQDPARALQLAETSGIAKLRQFIIRRAAANLDGLDVLLTWTQQRRSSDEQQMVLEQMLKAFEGQVGIKMPSAWQATYAMLSRSPDETLRAPRRSSGGLVR